MDKYKILIEQLRSYQKVAIAYSGGCDSDFLLHASIEALGKENVLAISCIGDMMSSLDKQDVNNFLQDVLHLYLDIDVWKVPEFCQNDKKRCYFCKKNIMTHVMEEANKRGFIYILDGQNKDDGGVYRPGIQACKELGILSPLADCGFTKDEVRLYSKKLGTKTYAKPANACLASRFDYGVHLTKEKLNRVDQAEQRIKQRGIINVRVRVQDSLARIEIEKDKFQLFLDNLDIIEEIKALGFRYVTLDLEGLRSGGYDEKK